MYFYNFVVSLSCIFGQIVQIRKTLYLILFEIVKEFTIKRVDLSFGIFSLRKIIYRRELLIDTSTTFLVQQ